MNIYDALKFTLVSCLAASPLAQADDSITEQIAQLRTQREKAIRDAVADCATALERLQRLYADQPEAIALIDREKEQLAKGSRTGALGGARGEQERQSEPDSPRRRPQARTPEALERYLVGTRWNYYDNDKFLGVPKKLAFTGATTATIDGKPIEWHALEKAKIWITGNREFNFNSLFDEFDGGWVPNVKERNTGRLIK